MTFDKLYQLLEGHGTSECTPKPTSTHTICNSPQNKNSVHSVGKRHELEVRNQTVVDDYFLARDKGLFCEKFFTSDGTLK